KSLAVPCADDGVLMQRNTRLHGQVIERPHIVVPDVDMDRNAAVVQLRKLSQQAGEAARHHLLVLEPHIEQITQNVDFRGIRCGFLQKVHDPLLSCYTARVVRYPEVEVGKEVDLLAGGHGPKMGKEERLGAGKLEVSTSG